LKYTRFAIVESEGDGPRVAYIHGDDGHQVTLTNLISEPGSPKHGPSDQVKVKRLRLEDSAEQDVSDTPSPDSLREFLKSLPDEVYKQKIQENCYEYLVCAVSGDDVELFKDLIKVLTDYVEDPWGFEKTKVICNNKNKDELIFFAKSSGMFKEIRRASMYDEGLNMTLKNGNNLMHHAVLHGYADILSDLIQDDYMDDHDQASDAMLAHINKDGFTPIELALAQTPINKDVMRAFIGGLIRYEVGLGCWLAPLTSD
jgi:hypothetical protein